jgi:hypothetical protein
MSKSLEEKGVVESWRGLFSVPGFPWAYVLVSLCV